MFFFSWYFIKDRICYMRCCLVTSASLTYVQIIWNLWQHLIPTITIVYVEYLVIICLRLFCKKQWILIRFFSNLTPLITKIFIFYIAYLCAENPWAKLFTRLWDETLPLKHEWQVSRVSVVVLAHISQVVPCCRLPTSSLKILHLWRFREKKKKHYFSSNQIVFTQTIKCLFKSDIIFNGHQQDQQMVL